MNETKEGKLPNLKVKINDEEEFETLPTIGSVVLAFATRTDDRKEENENIVSFVINEGQRKLLVDVEKQNLKPFELSSATELKVGMFAIIMGQIADVGIVVNEEYGVMQIFEAEEVRFAKVDELEPQVRKVLEE